MKFQFLYIVLAGFFIAGISFNFSGGPATSAGQDLTGSPIGFGAFCSNCHSSGAFMPTLEIQLTDAGTPVDKFEPGKTYQLVLTTTATVDTPVGYGFQAVALDNDNVSQGTFGALPADVQVADLGGVNYVEHGKRLDSNVLTVDWTAPAAGAAGTVTFYAATIAADGDNATGGDGAANATLSVSQEGVNTTGIGDFKLDIALLNNPVQDVLPIRIESSKGVNLKARLLNLSGVQVQEKELRIMQGEQVVSMEVGTLEKGIYFLQLTDGQSIRTEKVLKL